MSTRAWADLTGDSADGEPHATWDESPAFWLCTSGTTGQPKLAMHRHGSLRRIAEGYAREVLGIGPDDRSLSVAPLFHAYGLGNSLAFPLASGSTAILEPARPPTPALVAKLVARERPTLFYAVPTFYSALVAAGLPEETFASVRLAVSAGEALPARAASCASGSCTASRSWTGSARPNCSTSTSRTGPAGPGPERRASRSAATG